MSGNQDGKSLETMTGTQICLVEEAIKYCLEEYLIGYKSLIEFQYEIGPSEWYIKYVIVKVQCSRLIQQAQ